MVQILDCRPNPKGKGLDDQQRFLDRIKGDAKDALQRALKGRDLRSSGSETIAVPTRGITEPFFHSDGAKGRRTIIMPGNRQFVRGDKLPSASGGDAGGGEKGSRDPATFEVTVRNEEILKLLLDGLELPDFVKKRENRVFEYSRERTGYQTVGSPSQLSIPRTLRNSLGRRIALRRPKPAEIEALLRHLEEANEDCNDLLADQLIREIDRLQKRAKRIPYIDPFDVRYRRFEYVAKPSAQAVMFCLMDVSGSMDDAKKIRAWNFFWVLHQFLTRRYRYVQLIFIRHHSTAEEVDQQTFFGKGETGGTIVSTALDEMLKIARVRFGGNRFNIYVAQVSDGDNEQGDRDRCVQLMNEIIEICQHAAYVEVGGSTISELWRAYEQCKALHFAMERFGSGTSLAELFTKLYGAKKGAARAA